VGCPPVPHPPLYALRTACDDFVSQLLCAGTIYAVFAPNSVPRRPSPQPPSLLRKETRRIEELQARDERKAEMAVLTRDELIGILSGTVHAARNRLSEARQADGLKVAEMLAKMCGWNEPERVNVQSVEVKVNAALIARSLVKVNALGRGRAKRPHLCDIADTPAGGMPGSSPTL
jgi:hypothetical protein